GAARRAGAARGTRAARAATAAVGVGVAEDVHLPDRVAIDRCACGPVHAHEARAHREACQVIDAVADGEQRGLRYYGRRTAVAVVELVHPVLLVFGLLPGDADAVHLLETAQVDDDPLRI